MLLATCRTCSLNIVPQNFSRTGTVDVNTWYHGTRNHSSQYERSQYPSNIGSKIKIATKSQRPAVLG